MNKNSRLLPLVLAVGLGAGACGHAETRMPAPAGARTLYLHVEGMKKAKGGAT